MIPKLLDELEAKADANKRFVKDCNITDVAVACAVLMTLKDWIEISPKLIAALREADRALETMQKHCVCDRNIIGFDYGETHKNLGKPRAGARWLTPDDIARSAHAKISEIMGGEK